MDVTTLKVGTVGEILVLDVNITLEGGETTFIDVLKPDLTIVSWPATPVAGTTNINYELVEGDLDQVGNYYVTPLIDGVLGETARIRVIERFD